MQLTQDNLTVPFNPESSASILKVKIGLHSKLTVEIVAEVYKAKEYYSNRGHRSDLLTDVSKLASFKAYLDYAGLYEVKAYRWLERYVPEENKLLTYEELTEKKTLEKQEQAAEARGKMSQDERDRSMLVEFSKTGVKPIGWTDKLDKRMRDDEIGYAKQQERIDKLKQEQNTKSEEAKKKQAFTDPPPDDEKAGYYYRLGKTTEEMLNNASAASATHSNKRLEWKEKIRLSAGGKDDAFNDAILDYLETLENDNRRIEACNNIIKICRNISVDLQKAR